MVETLEMIQKEANKIFKKIKEEYHVAAVIGSVVAVGVLAAFIYMQSSIDARQQAEAETTEGAENVTEEVNQYIEDGVVTNPDDILVLVNDNRRLPDGFVPQNLVVPDVEFSFSGIEERNHLRQEAAEALEKLFALAAEDGIELFAVSGYRSYERQAVIFNRNVEQMGFEDASTFSAEPGHSEHQLGLAMDVTSRSVGLQITQDFGDTEEGQWLAENAHRAGFIIRYLKGKEEITGFSFEPWHIRYVGDSAEEISKLGITLEEYLGLE